MGAQTAISLTMRLVSASGVMSQGIGTQFRNLANHFRIFQGFHANR